MNVRSESKSFFLGSVVLSTLVGSITRIVVPIAMRKFATPIAVNDTGTHKKSPLKVRFIADLSTTDIKNT